MEISNYFGSWQPITILWLILIFFSLDVFGWKVTQSWKPDLWFRPVFWIFGLAIFTFFWFIIHFFWYFDHTFIWLSLSLPVIFFGKSYWKNKALISLFASWYKNPVSVIVLLPIAKNLFFWLGSPPYEWDEMAYHFYSPAQVFLEKNWNFVDSGFYSMLPRFFDTVYVLLFSITNTYLTSRFFHLLFLISVLTCIGIYLKSKVGQLTAAIYLLLSIWLNLDIIRAATTGYVDAASAAASLLFMVTAFNWLEKKTIPSFYLSISALAIALSIKYSTISFIIGTIFVALFVSLIKLLSNFRKRNFKLSQYLSSLGIWRIIRNSSLFFLCFGGYWYLKNLLFTGNPIYPFLLPCRSSRECDVGHSFFETWTDKIHLDNLQPIIQAVFHNDILVYQFALIALGFALSMWLVFRQFKLVKGLFVLLAAVGLDLIISSKISGFVPRFYYHWYLLYPLAFALPFSFVDLYFKHKIKLTSRFQVLVAVFVLGYVFYVGYKILNPVAVTAINDFNNPASVRNELRAFARGRISILDWTRIYFPQTYPIIHLCGKASPMKTLWVADPLLIWRDYEGLMRIFMINCSFEVVHLDFVGPARNSDLLLSLDDCHPEATNPYSQDTVESEYYQLNQKLVCGSEQLMPHLYQFVEN